MLFWKSGLSWNSQFEVCIKLIRNAMIFFRINLYILGASINNAAFEDNDFWRLSWEFLIVRKAASYFFSTDFSIDDFVDFIDLIMHITELPVSWHTSKRVGIHRHYCISHRNMKWLATRLLKMSSSQINISKRIAVHFIF